MNFYYFSVCHVCKEHSPDLKRCQNCKTVYYCSQEHQKSDWSNHKKLCRAIVSCEKPVPPPTNPDVIEYNTYKIQQAVAWGLALNRELLSHENDMWMFPKTCTVCYSREAPIVCDVCLSVAYCSEMHREQHRYIHESFCQSLKQCLEIEQSLFRAENPECVLDFKANFGKEMQHLPENLEEVIYSMDDTYRSYYSDKRAQFLQLTNLLSHVVSMVYALEKSGFIKNRVGKKDELIIHAARSGLRREYSVWLLFARFLSHWIVNLKQVKIFWVRPNDTNRSTSFTCMNCAKCTAKNFKILLTVYSGTYEMFIKMFPKPDLVVLFNIDGPSELHDNCCLEVRKDIPILTNYKKVPALLTSFTKRDLDQALSAVPSDVEYIVEPQLNKYRSLRPARNFEAGFEPIQYYDHFAAVISKK